MVSCLGKFEKNILHLRERFSCNFLQLSLSREWIFFSQRTKQSLQTPRNSQNFSHVDFLAPAYFLFESLAAALSLLMIQQEVSSVSPSLYRSLHSQGPVKREMTPQGFYGDTFSDGFGGFRTMKRNEQNLDIEANNVHLFTKF